MEESGESSSNIGEGEPEAGGGGGGGKAAVESGKEGAG